MAVGVLQPLTGQRRAPGGGADEEAAGELVGHRPDPVAGALEAEHRVEDVERDHVLAVRGVRRPGRGRRAPSSRPRRCPRGAAGPAATPCRRAAACGRPTRSSARAGCRSCGSRTSSPCRTCGTRPGRSARSGAPISGSLTRSLISRTSAIVVATDCLPGALLELGVHLVAGQLERLGAHHPLRQRAAELLAALHHVLDLVGAPRPGGTAAGRRFCS